MNKITQFFSRFRYPTWVIILLVLFVYFYTKELRGVSDFGIFYLAIQDFWQGIDIYSKLFTDCHCWHYFYSPFFALSFSSITWLPTEPAGWVWKFISLLLLYRNWVLFASYFDLRLFTKKDIKYWTLMTFFGGLWLIYANLHNHQMTIFIIWAIFESLRLLDDNKEWRGALLLAVSINFKIMPLVLLPYLLYRGHFKMAYKTIIWTVVLLFIPALFVGFDYNNMLLTSWFELINPLNKEHNFDVSEKGSASITTLIPILLHENHTWDTAFTWSRHIINLSEKTVIIVVQVVRAIIILFTLYFLRTKIFKPEPSRLKQMWELSYLLIAGLLIFPHQQSYAFYFLFPAIVYVVYAVKVTFKIRDKNRYVWIPILLILFLLISAEFYFGNFHAFIRYTKLLTYGSLLLAVVLVYLRPSKITEQLGELKQQPNN
jgi:hypothetical protein